MRFPWVLLLAALTAAVPGFSVKECPRAVEFPHPNGPWLDAAAVAGIAGAFGSLPEPGSAEFNRWAEAIGRSLDTRSGRGYEVIDTSRWLPAAAFRPMLARFPVPCGLPVRGPFAERVLFQGDTGPQPPELALAPSDRHALSRLVPWLDALLSEAVGHGVLAVDAEFRLARGTDIRATGFADWHADGHDLNVALALEGLGTEVLPEAPRTLQEKPDAAWRAIVERQEERGLVTARGQMLIFTGERRAARHRRVIPSIHRTPRYDGDRIYFIGRFQER